MLTASQTCHTSCLPTLKMQERGPHRGAAAGDAASIAEDAAAGGAVQKLAVRVAANGLHQHHHHHRLQESSSQPHAAGPSPQNRCDHPAAGAAAHSARVPPSWPVSPLLAAHHPLLSHARCHRRASPPDSVPEAAVMTASAWMSLLLLREKVESCCGCWEGRPCGS